MGIAPYSRSSVATNQYKLELARTRPRIASWDFSREFEMEKNVHSLIQKTHVPIWYQNATSYLSSDLQQIL